MMHLRMVLAVGLFAALAGAVAAQAPIDVDPGRAVRTRADLERLLAYYEEVLASPAYSAQVKAAWRSDAERVRTRLRDGDFRLGDRISIYVQGEPEVPDTLSVQAGPMVAVLPFGDVSLAGVLRSEVQSHLTEALKRYIREPVVRASALMRVSIQGAVGQPGFYVMPADMLVGEALMVAGGPATNADLRALRIERGTQVIVGGDVLQDALREGLTLDQLNLRAGDQVVLPARTGGFWGRVAVVSGVVGSMSFLILRLVR